ncbi:MAG: hypothetical protein ABEK02_05945 [Haloquadratum sp.]
MSDAENRREVARRVFAAEFDDATLSYSEGDEERAPNYVVTPTGARINRLFAVGALTEVERVGDEVLRGRIADPTGVFVTYAGQYQPDAMGFLDRAAPPTFVSITGKARTYRPEDSDRIFTSVRPESINEVDADTRDRWVVAAAEATLERIATVAAALDLEVRGDDLVAALEARGVDAALARGVALALEHYGPTEHYLESVRELAVQALELVAGEREAVDSHAAAPAESGPKELGPLPAVAAASASPGDTVASVEGVGGASDDRGDSEESPAEPAEGDAGSEPAAASETDAGGAPESGSADLDDGEMYELDEEERAAIESEYGTEFATGNEVEAPGEADIDVPDVDELEAEPEAGDGDAPSPGVEPGGESVSGTESNEETASDAEPSEETAPGRGTESEAADESEPPDAPADVDLEEAAVAVMADLDDGDGADREAVVAAVVEEYGADPGDVDDAIQEALMSGKCYEPAEDTLKAI